jgi:hypothetical protein
VLPGERAIPNSNRIPDGTILANPLLKQVYKQAILKGCAFEKVKK